MCGLPFVHDACKWHYQASNLMNIQFNKNPHSLSYLVKGGGRLSCPRYLCEGNVASNEFHRRQYRTRSGLTRGSIEEVHIPYENLGLAGLHRSSIRWKTGGLAGSWSASTSANILSHGCVASKSIGSGVSQSVFSHRRSLSTGL